MKLCCIDTDSFILFIKKDAILKDITKGVETRFDTSNYELDRPLPKVENKEKLLINEILIRCKRNNKAVGLRVKT